MYEYYSEDVNNIKVLNEEERKELMIKAKNGDSVARKMFLEQNLRLVLYFSQFYKRSDIDIEDLIQEGNIGLLIALDKYDINSENTFSTYAGYWIKQKMGRYIDENDGTIRIPIHMRQKMRKLKSTITEYEYTYGKTPTNKELADIMNMSVEDIEIITRNYEVVSINQIVEGTKDITIEDNIIDESINIEEDYEEKDFADYIKYVISNANLTEKEYNVIKYRYGFNGKPYTLDEIGKIYNITRERVRQIETKALNKIKFCYLHSVNYRKTR